MDFANRGNHAAPQKKTFGSDMPSMKKMSSSSSAMERMAALFMMLGSALLLASIVVVLIFGGKINVNKEYKLIDEEKYQAVFLESTDGQVYFGKLGIFNDDLYVLSDIYYLRVEQQIQPESEQPKNNVSLAKLGNELHAPEDFMYSARDKVMFWENLKDDGQVVKAISQYKANGGTTQDTSNSSSEETTDTTTP